MNIGKFCPLALCTLIGNFRIYLYIVLLVLAFRNLGSSLLEWLLPPLLPLQPPQSSETRLGQVGQSLHLTFLPPKPFPEGPQSMENFLGDFLGEILALLSKWFGCKNPRTKSAQTSVKKKTCKKKVHKFVQKSAQKSEHKICAKQVRTNGFVLAAPQNEKPKMSLILFMLFFCKLASTTIQLSIASGPRSAREKRNRNPKRKGDLHVLFLRLSLPARD